MDFRVASLNTLRYVLESTETPKIRVLLIYAQHLDDSITDLLFHSPAKSINALISPEFKEALEILKNRFREKLEYVSVKPFYGYTKAFLKNFTEYNKVDLVVIPTNYKFQPGNRSFDPRPLLKKGHTPVLEISLNANEKHTQQEQLVALFN